MSEPAMTILLLVACFVIQALGVSQQHGAIEEYCPASLYPPMRSLTASPGDTTYHVDPLRGNDKADGKTAATAWKSTARVNGLLLGPGDKVVVAPGVLHESLAPTAIGTKTKPVVIQFLPGIHEFRSDRAIKLRYFVSNSADAPEIPQPIGILVKNCRHIRIGGGKGCEIRYGDRMTEFINDHSEDIAYSDLVFDMVRPTVSEFRVLETGANDVVVQTAEGSTYAIENGRFSWTGDLGNGWTMAQEAEPETGRCWRRGQWDPFDSATAQDMGGGKICLTYKNGNLGMEKGRQYQFRKVERDTTSAVNTRCKGMTFRDCTFHALPGMGIVSQFTENITFERVLVVPRPGTLRTCPAWADCLHFSGCRGKVLIDSCNFSGTQDDPINVHGTHLRIIEKTAPNQILVRYMHPQTYGFAPYQPGDKMNFVNHATLLAYADANIESVERRTDRDWLLTLDRAVPKYGSDDVVDNITWYPDTVVRNCRVTMDSCRGFLITTRGKVLVENNTFIRTAMSAIDISDDANSWFESGPVRNVTIRGNRFIQCGEPVIRIMPESRPASPAKQVHSNIRILNNLFDGGGIAARSVKGLVVTGNRFTAHSPPLQTDSCTDVVVEKNETGVHPDDGE